jgi:hypothetical protein
MPIPAVRAVCDTLDRSGSRTVFDDDDTFRIVLESAAAPTPSSVICVVARKDDPDTSRPVSVPRDVRLLDVTPEPKALDEITVVPLMLNTPVVSMLVPIVQNVVDPPNVAPLEISRDPPDAHTHNVVVGSVNAYPAAPPPDASALMNTLVPTPAVARPMRLSPTDGPSITDNAGIWSSVSVIRARVALVANTHSSLNCTRLASRLPV